jgi:SAM-dependent methyltransferase
MADTVNRFTNRVAMYVRARPSYPYAVLRCLVETYGLGPATAVADMGAGTGLLTRRLLTAGCTVRAVDPNDRMRAAADAMLGGHPGYTSQSGTAEATGLADRSVDFVTAGQAFHWFDVPKAHAESRRILRPGGYVALVWNARRASGTPFMDGYQQIIDTYGLDYTEVDHAQVVDEQTLADFFGDCGFAEHYFTNQQILDVEGVVGRLSSTSYMPAPDHPRYGAMVEAVEKLVSASAERGKVAMLYDTQLFVGRL